MASVRRLFNELEQTLSDYGINLGTKNLQIKDSKAFKDAYGAAFKVFGAEAHHIIDLSWVDRTLGAAGLSPESRSYVIEQLNKQGIDTGNHPLNISPQPQRRPKYGRTGMAHKWVHDLYKQIPSAEQVFNVDSISKLSEDEIVEYMVEAGRMRKQIVVDAMNHKLASLRKAVPESSNWSSDEIRQYASKNKKTWGSLGDDTFQQVVKLPDPTKIPTVTGQPRGRIPIPPDTENTLLARNLGFISADPVVHPCVKGGNVCIKLAKRKPSVGLPVADVVAGTALKFATDPDIGARDALTEATVDTAQELITDYSTSAVETTQLGNGARVGHDKDRNIVYPTAGVEESNGNKGIAVLNGKNVLVERGSVAGIKPDYQVAFDNAAGFLKLVTTGLSKRIENALDAAPSPYKPTEIPNR